MGHQPVDRFVEPDAGVRREGEFDRRARRRGPGPLQVQGIFHGPARVHAGSVQVAGRRHRVSEVHGAARESEAAAEGGQVARQLGLPLIGGVGVDDADTEPGPVDPAPEEGRHVVRVPDLTRGQRAARARARRGRADHRSERYARRGCRTDRRDVPQTESAGPRNFRRQDRGSRVTEELPARSVPVIHELRPERASHLGRRAVHEQQKTVRTCRHGETLRGEVGPGRSEARGACPVPRRQVRVGHIPVVRRSAVTVLGCKVGREPGGVSGGQADRDGDRVPRRHRTHDLYGRAGRVRGCHRDARGEGQ